ncbi:hypothetical protein BOX24_02110 [Leptospirillum ferriphilum]|uniref:Uncharacterized protein n=1 Tax=Leptospirillum ferriphilum TaxID=178606 RepID=A0A1V3SXK0_9BACT|nr:hypothetical protein BOX24_02110 [Leptospirillum ferriphilum]
MPPKGEKKSEPLFLASSVQIERHVKVKMYARMFHPVRDPYLPISKLKSKIKKLLELLSGSPIHPKPIVCEKTGCAE